MMYAECDFYSAPVAIDGYDHDNLDMYVIFSFVYYTMSRFGAFHPAFTEAVQYEWFCKQKTLLLATLLLNIINMLQVILQFIVHILGPIEMYSILFKEIRFW